MPTIQINIQGLTHRDVAEQRESFLQTAVGRRIVLRPAHLQEDSRAVEAFVSGMCVGVVARLDLDQVWAALHGEGKTSLHGRIARVHEYVLVAEFEVASLAQVEMPAGSLEGWNYSGPLLAERAEERKLAFLEEEMTSMLKAGGELSEEDVAEAMDLVTSYCKTAPYDISKECLQMRSKLVRLLKASPRPELRQAAEKVREMSQRMGGNGWMQHLGEWMQAELPTSREAQMITVEPTKLADISAEAERLPQGLLALWHKDAAQFARVLYGMCPSREKLREVLSCMVVLELMGCTHEKAEAKVDEFVQQIVDETKHLYKHERRKADTIRQVMIRLGRKDADQELDAWMEQKEAKKAAVQIDVKAGAHAQISEKGITNNYPQLPKEE